MDNLSPEDRRKNMQHIRSKNTKPELAVFKELRKRKIYFAKHVQKIYGRPDIVFRRKKVVVFIDSDFWHQNPLKPLIPKSNVDYWTKKLQRNVQRDIKVNTVLVEQGWKVIRIWESDIKKDLDAVVGRILSAIGR